MAKMMIILAGALLAHLVQAGEWGHWQEHSEDNAGRWTDYAEATPDMVPDAWLIEKLARFEAGEVMLRGSSGAMLRWVPMEYIDILSDVQRSIENAAEMKVALYLTRGEQPNAAAGIREGVNTVWVNFAMLDMVQDRQDEWAALIGHEIAHLKLKHGEERGKRNIPIMVLKSVSAAVIADPLTGLASQYLIDGVGNSFSRNEESEADYMGVIWAVQSDFDAYGGAALHAKMNERSLGHPVPFLSSHPSGEHRIKELTELADRLSVNQ